MIPLRQRCKEVGITIQQYHKWLKHARDMKGEYIFILKLDDKPFAYFLASRCEVEKIRIELFNSKFTILMEIMV